MKQYMYYGVTPVIKSQYMVFLLTLGKRLLGVWFAPNQRNEWVIAVVHLVPELQLRSLDVPRVDELVATNLLTYRLL